MGMDRKGSAVWRGTLKEGKGTVSTESGALNNTNYSFASRFVTEGESNPEELIGAAHAGCYSMALSGGLGGAGFTAKTIATTATITIEPVEGGFGITKIHLDCEAEVEGIDAVTFEEIAQATKLGCPVSKLLNTPISLSAKLK
ncbi:MAG: OsmC family peroxiredoxin [Fimbriimonadaceae bacterium]|nr:OsmC family peroxiredoxin [Fimbriimonadaceae bacterium]